ncbi:MAG: hypothetical protein KFB93_05765 [Simkaniaceae bacterium]|nr:MAG: hypothetical protein KFB93_05765 [Simkaniaceae bacterium]
MSEVRPIHHAEAYNHIKPVFDQTFGGSYPSRPDTIASMAKTAGKRLLIVTIALGVLYVLYSIFTRRSASGSSPSDRPSSPETDQKDEFEESGISALARVRPDKTTFNESAGLELSMLVIPRDIPLVIYNPMTAQANEEILQSYQRILEILKQNGVSINALKILLNGLMIRLGSSDTFKDQVITHKNEQAIIQLVDFVVDNFREHLSSFRGMPKIATNKESVVAKINKIINPEKR